MCIEFSAELKGRQMTSEEFISEAQKLQKSLWDDSSFWPRKGRVDTSAVLRLAIAADKMGHPMKLRSVGNSGVALVFLTSPPFPTIPPEHMLSIADVHLMASNGYRRAEDLVRIAIAIFEPIVQNERNLNRLDWYGLKRPPKGTQYWEY